MKRHSTFLKKLQLASVLLWVLAVAACSHTRPHYRGDVPTTQRQQDEYLGVNDRPYLDTVRYRVLLIGDAGLPRQGGEPVLESLQAWAAPQPDRTAVVFLGDNIYEWGMRDDSEEEKDRLRPQIEAAGEATVLIIPGNHDWAKGSEAGKSALANQQRFVSSELGASSFPLRDGEPGPVSRELPEERPPAVRIIALDTQWWLHEHDRPADVAKVRQEAIDELAAELDTDLPTILVVHHPLKTRGPHGEFFDWQDYLVPMHNRWGKKTSWLASPIGIGAVVGGIQLISGSHPIAWLLPAASALAYPAGRRIWSNPQDLHGKPYRTLREDLRKALESTRPSGEPARPLLYAAGHDHSLQFFEGDAAAQHHLVSGAGSQDKLTQVGDRPATLFAHEHTGFAVVDFVSDADEGGEVWLRIVEPQLGKDGSHTNIGREPSTFTIQLR